MATIYAGKGQINSVNPYLSLTVTQGAQDIAGNFTYVNYTVKLHRPSSVSSSATKTVTFKINGVDYSASYTMGGSGDKTLASGAAKVPHNADGTKSVAFSVSSSFGITWGGKSLGTVSASGSMALSTIPRATTPKLSATSAEMGTALTIELPRAVGTFKHSLWYSITDGIEKLIVTDVGTSYSWVVPDLSESFPNAISGTVTLVCYTWDANDKLIGSARVPLTAVVPSSYVPSISSVRRSETTAGLAAQFGAYVQGKSKLAVEINGTGVAGSTIKAYEATLDGVVYQAQSFTTELLTTAGTLELKVRVQDSRGRWSEYMTVDVVVLEYAPPKIKTFKAWRCNSAGTAADDGEYIAVQYDYSVSPLGNKNTASAVVSYSLAEAEQYTNLLSFTALSGSGTSKPKNKTFTTDNRFDLKMVVTDWFGASDTADALLPTAEVVLDISADGSAIGFGKVSEVANSMEVARDALFHNPAEFLDFAQFPASYGGGYDAGGAIATLAEVGGGRTRLPSGTTGVLKVLLPQDFNGTIISFDVDVYSYNKQTIATYSFAAQIAKNNSTGVYKWSSPAYYVRGHGTAANLPISFGRHNGKAAVAIGAADTAWGYSTVVVRNVKTFMGNYYKPSYWQSGWSIVCDTSALTEVMNTYQNPGVVDYIVEQGVDGIWHYEKWASGKALLKGSYKYASSTFAASGSVFYRTLSAQNFPSGFFTGVPYHALVTGVFGNAGAVQLGTLTQTGIGASAISAVSTAREVQVYFEVEGNWK